ncbi:hypothetical protein HNR31_000059 [Anoxybacillus caldiproteolyticus]|uniref:Uncharacterized protein n=1 Tax=Thermaerobacillus caldiproteolyticus TaxID=247480 RepID=A0A7V9Z3B6_9BACL|nr:hypothetical protein [Anoxybacillus caldiproteolyticus]
MNRKNWLLFFILLGASLLWGLAYWLFIAG